MRLRQFRPKDEPPEVGPICPVCGSPQTVSDALIFSLNRSILFGRIRLLSSLSGGGTEGADFRCEACGHRWLVPDEE